MNDGEIVFPPEVTMKSRARSTRRSAPARHSGADCELQPVQAELVEDRYEHAGAASAVEGRVSKPGLAAPAALGVLARNSHGDSCTGALEAAGVVNAEQDLRGEFLQVAGNGEQDG